MQSQRWLFGNVEPTCDRSFARLERVVLGDGAWLDVAGEWLAGHARLFDELHDTVAWREEDVKRMYDRVVAVPRLFAMLAPGCRPTIVEEMRLALVRAVPHRLRSRQRRALSRRPRQRGLARRLRRAYHARGARGHGLGRGAAQLLVRPTGGGRSWSRAIGCGDLVVMGGTVQRTHQHAIPKVARAEPRIAIMFRPSWDG